MKRFRGCGGPKIDIGLMLEVIEEQAEQGVDYMTIHAGVLRNRCRWCGSGSRGSCSRGGSLMAHWMEHHKKQNFLYENYRRDLQDFQEARREFFAGRRVAAGLPGGCERRSAVRGIERCSGS